MTTTIGAFNLYSNSQSAPGYYYRIGSGAILTFTSSMWNITKIVLTYRAKGSINGFTNKSDGSFNDTKSTTATWTGTSNSISLRSSNTNNLTSVTITYAPAITISESTYATFWYKEPYIMPAGLTGYTIGSTDEGIIYGHTYATGTTVPANTPLLIRGPQGTHNITTATSEAPIPTPNMLVCATGETVSNGDTYYYKVSYKSSTDHTVGFYWDSMDGHSITLPYGKAFLPIPLEAAIGAKGYDITNIANGLAIPTVGNKAKLEIGETLYDINGKQHTYSTTLPQGVYITSKGQKFVINR